MRTLVLSLLALQAAPAPTGPAGQAGPSGPSEEPQSEASLQADVEPWGGTLAAGIQAIRSQAESGELEAALALSERVLAPTEFARLRRDWAERSDGWSEWIFDPVEPLLDGLGLGGWPDPELGEVHYARGLVRGLEMNAEEAIGEFERAAALAEDGSLRLDALYDAGATMLAVAEAAFAQVPEVSGAPQGAPGMPGMPGAPGAQAAGADPEAPDPLDLAEAAFRLAKEKLIVRLRADWQDEDTRANLEWIQRRLAEIEELRKQREEQQQEQQQEQQSDENQDGEPNEDSEEQEQDDEQQDQEQQDEQDQEQQDQEQQDQQDEDQEDSEEQDTEPEESEDEEPTEAEAPEPEPGEEGEEQPAAPEEGEELAERVLTREEVMRLLDLLQEIEEEGERVRARARAQGRQKVEKDW